MTKHYQLGLLYLVKLLIDADGIADEKELAALHVIKEKECIPDSVFFDFENEVRDLKEQDVYNVGIEHLSRCSGAEKLNIFCLLYKLSEVDGRVHLKEIKLLLYSIKTAGIAFDDVVTQAKMTTAFA